MCYTGCVEGGARRRPESFPGPWRMKVAQPILVVGGGSFVQSVFGIGCWDKGLSRGVKSRKGACVPESGWRLGFPGEV